MNPALIYLHIPKSAGTSHRAYLDKVYGEEGYFWYGVHSNSDEFDAEEVGDLPALGGHRPLTFYPPEKDALYTSAVRNPVDRAISFFNYCTVPPSDQSSYWSEKRVKAQEEWLQKGIDPSSFIRSVEHSDAFRFEISNYQCAYLSRHGATFAGVQQTLQEENFVIGVFEELDRFNEFFRESLNFVVDNRARANVGSPGYSQNILKEPGLIELILSLNNEDMVLYNYLRLAHGGLYIGAENIEAVRERVPSISSRSNVGTNRAQFKLQSVQLFGKGLIKLGEDNTALAPIAVRNTTGKHLIFSTEASAPLAIGWRIRAGADHLIEGLQGIYRLDHTIPARDIRMVNIPISVPDTDWAALPDNLSVEFSLVHGDDWLVDTWMLSSTWSKLHV